MTERVRALERLSRLAAVQLVVELGPLYGQMMWLSLRRWRCRSMRLVACVMYGALSRLW